MRFFSSWKKARDILICLRRCKLTTVVSYHVKLEIEILKKKNLSEWEELENWKPWTLCGIEMRKI